MQLHHFALRSHDLSKLVAFYTELFGLPVLRKQHSTDQTLRSVWLQIGSGVLMLERADADEPVIPKGSQEFFALRVTVEEREQFLEKLVRAAVPLEARTEHTLYFRDPDGRRVGVSSYPFEL